MDKNIKQFVTKTLKQAGNIVKSGFQKSQVIKVKADHSNIVTETDVLSERSIIKAIQKRFPNDSIIAEESGFGDKNSDYVWIIDPIDGTSNFASGIPWCAVMMSRLQNWQSVATGIYLPFFNRKNSSKLCFGVTL
ncbi:hypothetical protein A3A55_03535 [Candidatus Roizmanbacteria bacterium RIFCSPLOWO2_01_FULL_40_14]|uniref:Inositol-phosphate phosphatase n=1 Tax=Candidatus Gottesmanbacteria bacterium GW2011_GWB1_43_11 TaxID=1618446 RepID=A0A0G1CN06_9BACT|nr:MAG: Inositol-phosphate phosphatase [Candidatus Gottesmanbacteria bacterium GW2011_GWA2_42_16]KKS54475.1 MAG: Inositol-phosphate phosphatase [Candidatus Gottesmanbacteria bacterium GW2011_GWA1_42_26]KKS82207.1 MAG: Inositol-phosphate phosphatase [Candidatus Gottesmanbacteria bacterium GW2011_GWC1_43_10]KKS87105.1 MAG: Inositol-phosphate phosphatase [Candidatus Gottesmanbacteria bacterium GW2011_GWB1_43_11]OGG10407.1 MAG: hypothetical protein A2699_05060 [Candidatus Gottesmanbacteria bacteriu